MNAYDEQARSHHFHSKMDRPSLAGFRRIDGGTPVSRSELLSARQRIVATTAQAGGRPVVGGIAASIVHGNPWFDPDFAVELLRVQSGSGKHGDGRTAHRFILEPSDVVNIDGVLVTTPVRTAFDVGRITPAWRGLGHLDALHRATGFPLPRLIRYIERHPRWRHIRQLRAIAPLIDGAAESPPESWLRLLIYRGELPSPETQIEVLDEHGHVFARIDMGYRDAKVGIEYDGEDFHSQPWQRDRDTARDARLEALGWTVIRVNAERLREEPWRILVEIERALRSRGVY